MTSEPDIDSIFCQAIEFAADTDRQDFLERACGVDAELRARVDRLLAAHARAGHFMQDESPGTVAVPCPLELVGSHIGPYKLREQLGEGGMGTVWAADQKHPLRRRVALKVIKPGMDSGQVLARFDAEREALALMDHPNIARVLDAGTTAQGRPYFVMELIHGLPITAYCDAHELPVRERLSLFIQVCRGVQHAHQKGIIHRDIKPSNVLVTEQDGAPIPKIIDFGVAKALHQPLADGSIYTGVFQAIGTLAYMSPEQATLSPKDIDTRVDVYGLGALLFELLTGNTPVHHKYLEQKALDEAFRIIREQDVPKPSTTLSSLDNQLAIHISKHRGTDPDGLGKVIRGDLDWIVVRALNKDRGRRYPTPDAFAEDIQRHLQSQPVEARPPSASYRLMRFYQRNRTAVVSGAAMLLLLLTAIVGTSAGWLRAITLQRFAETESQRANEETESRRKQLILSDIVAIQRLLGENNIGDVRELIKRHEGEDDQELHEFAWEYYRRLINELDSHSRVIDLDQQATCVTFSPSGSQIAVGQLGLGALSGGLITIFDADTGKWVQNFGPKDLWSYALSYSPDGESLAFADDQPGRFIVRHLASGHETLLSGHHGRVKSVAFSANGEYLVSAGQDDFLLITDARTQTELRKLPVGDKGVAALVFSPDGSRLAVSGEDRMTRVWDSSTWEIVQEFSATLSDLSHCLAFSPDGGLLAYGTPRDEAVVRELATGKEVVLRGHRDAVRSVAFSPDGKFVVTGSRDGSVKLWDARSFVELRTLRGHTSFVQSIAFSPDGSLMASASRDYTVRIWDIGKLMAATNLVRPSHRAIDLAFAGALDGFLSLSTRGSIELWDKTTGRSNKPPDFSGAPILRMAVSASQLLALVTAEDVIIRDLRTGEELCLDHGGRLPPMFDDCSPAAFSHDGRFFALASEDGSIQVWDVGGENPPCCFNQAHHGPAECLAFDPCRPVLASGGRDGKIHLWELDRRQRIGTLDKHGHRAQVVCLAYTPDGRLLASASFDNTIKLWDPQEPNTTPRTISAHVGPVKTILISSSGRSLISTGGDNTVRIIDIETGQTKATFTEPRSAVCRLAISDDETVLASAEVTAGESIRFWRAR